MFQLADKISVNTLRQKMATAGRIPAELESDDDLSESMTKLKISKKKKKVRSGDRLYGFFRCDKCKKNWESSQVYVKYAEGDEVNFTLHLRFCGNPSILKLLTNSKHFVCIRMQDV